MQNVRLQDQKQETGEQAAVLVCIREDEILNEDSGWVYVSLDNYPHPTPSKASWGYKL